MWKLTRDTIGRPKWICCWAIATKARKVLGWQPKITFKALAKMMTDADMKIARHEKLIADSDCNSRRKAAAMSKRISA